MGLFIRSAKIFTLVLMGGVLAFGQQSQQPSASQSSPISIQQQANAPASASSNAAGTSLSASNGLAQPALLTPIYGLQGVLAETVEGGTVAAQSIDEKFNPASSIKLATALAALQTF